MPVHWRARRTRPRVEGPACPSSSGSVVRTPPGPDLKPRSCVRHLGLHSTARPTAHVRPFLGEAATVPRHHVHVSPVVPASARPPPPGRQRPAPGVRCISASAGSGSSRAGTRPRLGCVSFNRAQYGRSWRPSGVRMAMGKSHRVWTLQTYFHNNNMTLRVSSYPIAGGRIFLDPYPAG